MTVGRDRNRSGEAATAIIVSGSSRIELGPVSSSGEANDLLATAEEALPAETGSHIDGTRWLVLTRRQAETAEPDAEPMASYLQRPDVRSAASSAGVIVHPPLLIRSVDSTIDLARWIHRSFDGDGDGAGAGQMPAVAINIDAALAVGGFGDVTMGLGLAELATRLSTDGWAVIGAPLDPLAMQGLEPGLDTAGQLQAVAESYRLNGDRAGQKHFTRRVRRAAGLEVMRHRFDRGRGIDESGHGLLARQIQTDAAADWDRSDPDTVHSTVGQRADWRFLINRDSADHLWLADGRAPSGGRHFLEVDGWADTVSTGRPNSEAGSDSSGLADVVVIGLAEAPNDILGVAATDATVVLELGRNPIKRHRRIGRILAAGFELVGLYLVTPNLAEAKRYVSLNQPGAIGWLLAPPPPVEGTRTGPIGAAHRLFVRSVATAVAGVANLPFGPAMAGAGAQGVVVATRGSALPTNDELPEILMTSGHDEGSRAVIVDLGSSEAGTVTKMSPRPGYNHNVEAEGEVLESVRAKIRRSSLAQAEGLLPEINRTIDAGGLLGAQERYVGRWTATDLCNRVPASRVAVLTEVLGAIDRFSLATVDHTASWSPAMFDTYLGALFDRYDQSFGPNTMRDAFRAALSRRSMELVGRSMPMVQRHYDLGPWNVVFDDDGTDLTIIDWELAPPRSIGDLGLGGADQLYFCKYWLHIAMATRSVDEELAAFTFIPGQDQSRAAEGLRGSLHVLGLDHRFVPLLAGHLWLEAALYTSARRAEHGGDPGSAARYVDTLARRRNELLSYWS